MTPLQRLIDNCRRKQPERDRELGNISWATAEEALEEWRSRTFHPLDLRHIFGARLDPKVIVKSA